VTDTTGPVEDPTSPTEPLQLADQSPVYAAPAPAVEKRSHTRTILEVVAAGLAVVLILSAGAVGFAVGHATSPARGDHFRASAGMQGGPQAGGQGQFGQDQQGRGLPGFGQGGGMMGGQGPRGIDPDGDNWTGGMMGGQGQPGQGQFGPGQQGFGQGGGMMGGQGPRGIDPDGDNWTGGMMGGQGFNPNAPQNATPQSPAPQNSTPQPGQTSPSGA